MLSVSAQFTVTVGAAVVPSSVPAGSGAQGTINVNPLDGYTGMVTLACRSITPLVTIPPICSFNPPSLTVNGNTLTSTLTITTQGLAVPTGAVAHPRIFYALWLPLPMLALMGFGAASSRKGARKVWGVLGLFIVAGALMLTPACGNSTPTTNPNGVTPNNTYTFTLHRRRHQWGHVEQHRHGRYDHESNRQPDGHLQRRSPELCAGSGIALLAG